MNALISTALSGVLLMFVGLFVRNKQHIKYFAIAAVLVAFVANLAEAATLQGGSRALYGMIEVSRFSILFNAVALGATLLYFLLSGSEFEKVGKHVADYFALVFFILSGIMLASSFSNLLMLFLAIEIISIPQYILAGSDKKNLKSNEAALKYFLMGSFSTGILLMGIALIYGAAGTFNIRELALGSGTLHPLVISGIMLLIFALSFKVSAVPFHFWTPDVYQGAPMPIVALFSTGPKMAGMIVIMRFVAAFADPTIAGAFADVQLFLGIAALATLAVGDRKSVV